MPESAHRVPVDEVRGLFVEAQRIVSPDVTVGHPSRNFHIHWRASGSGMAFVTPCDFAMSFLGLGGDVLV